jgi:ABC-2 type transport system ATP-binding protein
VGLAHAMMNDPEILVLDEPTSGLDPNQIIEIRDIIRRIGKEKTIILSTHILSEAEATCDRVVIIHKGKIAADDLTENLKQAAGRENLVKLTLKNADATEAKEVLGTVSGVLRAELSDSGDEGLSIRLICGDDADVRESVYQAIKETDWILTELYQEQQTLENIFRQITLES